MSNEEFIKKEITCSICGGPHSSSECSRGEIPRELCKYCGKLLHAGLSCKIEKIIKNEEKIEKKEIIPPELNFNKFKPKN